MSKISKKLLKNLFEKEVNLDSGVVEATVLKFLEIKRQAAQSFKKNISDKEIEIVTKYLHDLEFSERE